MTFSLTISCHVRSDNYAKAFLVNSVHFSNIIPAALKPVCPEPLLNAALQPSGISCVGVPLGSGMLPLYEIMEDVSPKCETAILEMWTLPEDTVRATIRKEGKWANASINYLKQMISHV